MTSFVSLDELSFESKEGLYENEVRPEEALLSDVKSPATSKEFEELQTVFDVYNAIIKRKAVCRGDIETISPLADKYPALNRLLDEYPLGSFTAEPSTINYEVSTEGFVRTAFSAVVSALREVIRYIVESFKSMWRFLTENKARTRAVDDIESKLSSIQAYILEVERLMGMSRVSNEYRQWMRRAVDTQAHNLNKGWNGLKHLAATDPAVLEGYFDLANKTLTTKIPVFTAAVEVFLSELKASQTEQDVINAIAKMELIDMTSSDLIQLTEQMDYRKNAAKLKTNPRMTHFQTRALYVLNTLRSLSNDRGPQLGHGGTFQQVIVDFKITSWSSRIDEAMAWSGPRIQKAVDALENFKEEDVPTGLDKVYAERLTPFMTSLTSIIGGLRSLEGSMGMMVAARDNCAISVSKAALGVAKSADQFVLKNKDKLTLAELSIIKRYRGALAASFG